MRAEKFPAFHVNKQTITNTNYLKLNIYSVKSVENLFYFILKC